jgi:hypothetical protein
LFVEGFVDFFGHFDGASNQLSDFQKLAGLGRTSKPLELSRHMMCSIEPGSRAQQGISWMSQSSKFLGGVGIAVMSRSEID